RIVLSGLRGIAVSGRFPLGVLLDRPSVFTVETPPSSRDGGVAPRRAPPSARDHTRYRAGRAPTGAPRGLGESGSAGRGGQGLPARWGAGAPQVSLCGDA